MGMVGALGKINLVSANAGFCCSISDKNVLTVSVQPVSSSEDMFHYQPCPLVKVSEHYLRNGGVQTCHRVHGQQ